MRSMFNYKLLAEIRLACRLSAYDIDQVIATKALADQFTRRIGFI